ncbi:hypothetical protein A605_05945 [Corynebacterium halotolerans YIM 70093 = DSM 44683]|uniref:Uncharacterized protein n=1 Tax=Corynebacterium halotolerans YIM 70093 = DSM 44683 TaxID=1121362 RepID=M1NXH1_9CORY|nr:hypothetical protein A605_05945 [Corynebacterium halotolerans YIM 70093 = DSM 44683]
MAHQAASGFAMTGGVMAQSVTGQQFSEAAAVEPVPPGIGLPRHPGSACPNLQLTHIGHRVRPV